MSQTLVVTGTVAQVVVNPTTIWSWPRHPINIQVVYLQNYNKIQITIMYILLICIVFNREKKQKKTKKTHIIL
jgi:hypothetical protein